MLYSRNGQYAKPMEITSKLSQWRPYDPIQNQSYMMLMLLHSNNNYRTHHPYNSSTINNTTLTVSNHSTPKSPIQIQLPLNRPQHKQLQPIKAPNKTTTTSDVLRLMDSLGLPIPIDIYVSLIKECTDTRDGARAVEMHAHINRNGLRPRLPLLNLLLLMYVSCGCIDHARNVFDKMAIKDSNSWAAMIAGYAENGDDEEAIRLFIEMQHHHQHCHNNDILEFPVSWIVVCILKACVRTMNLGLGTQLHGWLLKVGYSTHLFLSSSLMNFYGKLGYLEGADLVFDQISRRNTVIWTAKIVNNCREGHFEEVLYVFNEMGRAGMRKNSFTFSSVLRACGKTSDGGHCGRQIHANAIKLGLESKSYVQCGLVDMYGKCGLVKDARRVFGMAGDERSVACWNAMLTGYIQHGHCIEAVKILYEMKAAGLPLQESLLNDVRFACASETLEN